MRLSCPTCGAAIGGDATEGGVRVRLTITLVDTDTGRIHGPCPHCKADVVLADTSTLSSLVRKGGTRRIVPGVRISGD